MLNLDLAQIERLMSVYVHRIIGDKDADPIWTALCAEYRALKDAKTKAAEIAEWEAKRERENAELLAAYPVKAGDLAEVKIGSRTYRAKVVSVATGRAHSKDDHSRYLHLEVLRKDGEPNKQMNGGKYGNGWYGWVAPADVTKVA